MKLGNSRRSLAVTAKEYTKKRDARAKLFFSANLVISQEPITLAQLLFDVLVAIAVVAS